VGNPNRPNGGILERFHGLQIPVVGVTFNGATPTNSTDMATVDVSREYDGWSDFPTNPLNLLADINAVAGIYYLHGNYFNVGEPQLQGQYGDTTYYLIPTAVLPILMPLQQVPLIGPPLALTLDPVLRILVEAGYDRTINPGQPTPAQWLYFPNPISTAFNVAIAAPTGLDNGIGSFTGNRPFGTVVPGPYGVGGPPVNTGCAGTNCGDGPTPSAAPNLTPVSLAGANEVSSGEPGATPGGPDPTLGDNPSANTAAQTQNSTPGKHPSASKPTSNLSVFAPAERPAIPTIRRPVVSTTPGVRDLVPSPAGGSVPSADVGYGATPRNKPPAPGDSTSQTSSAAPSGAAGAVGQ
jgi:hypothetical protein